MMNRIRNFIEHEDGAVTVDWVVLTAAIVGICASVYAYFGDPVKELDARSGAALSNVDVAEDISVNFDTTDP
jgi:Flp pilus assembly pilin Flp